MQQSILFDTATDDMQDVLDAVARAFGTTLVDVVDNDDSEPADRPQDGAAVLRLVEQPAPFGLWTYRRTVAFLRALKPTAYSMCVLLAERGSVTSSAVMDTLDVDTLRGHLSSLGWAKRNVRGLRNAQVYSTSTENGETVFTMPDPLRGLVIAAVREIDPESYANIA